MGLIKEKETSYVDAAIHYEKANKLTNEKSASIAFRLSFNYLKAKRYVDCINICKKILEILPTYPKIEKEVLEKARLSIK
jgi:tetratricopeptide repeat protein 21B